MTSSFAGSVDDNISISLRIGPTRFRRRAVMLRAEYRDGHRRAIEPHIVHMIAEPRADDVRVAPLRRRGETPGGGGGAYFAASANMRPTIISGGHVENAIVPPGRNTRSISAIATSGRGANM